METTDQLRSKVQTFHQSVLGRNLDTKTLNYWINCINNGIKTFEDLETNVLKSDEYKGSLTKKFKECYLDHVSSDISTDALERFVKAHVGKRVDNAMVLDFIRSLPEYDAKYIGIIQSAFTFKYNVEQCPDDFVKFYLNKFKTVPNYDLDKFGEDVSAETFKSSVRNADVASGDNNAPAVVVDDKTAAYAKFGAAFEDMFGRPPVQEDLEKFVDVMKGGVKVVEKAASFNNDAIIQFEQTFGRPIYVQEYFKYIHTMGLESFAEVKSTHEQNYNRLREIYQAYTGKVFGEYEYMTTYLNDVDEPSFFDTIVDAILNSKDYESGMRKVLVEKYKAQYDEILEEQDVQYLFKIVQKQQLSIVDDGLVGVLGNFKKETDEIIAHIFKQYMNILERQPDVYEIEQYVAYYRANLNKGMEEIDKDLESMIMKSLEFHDIIKKKIRAIYIYNDPNGKEILPSVMFDVLHRVLARIDSLTMNTLNDVIKEYI